MFLSLVGIKPNRNSSNFLYTQERHCTVGRVINSFFSCSICSESKMGIVRNYLCRFILFEFLGNLPQDSPNDSTTILLVTVAKAVIQTRLNSVSPSMTVDTTTPIHQGIHANEENKPNPNPDEA